MKTQTNRKDYSVENFLRIIKPILEQKELIGKPIKMTELSRICNNHYRRLPVRGYGAKSLTSYLLEQSMGHGCFITEGLIVDVFKDDDEDTGRDIYMVTIDYEVSLEQQCLNEMRARDDQPQSCESGETVEAT